MIVVVVVVVVGGGGGGGGVDCIAISIMCGVLCLVLFSGIYFCVHSSS